MQELTEFITNNGWKLSGVFFLPIVFNILILFSTSKFERIILTRKQAIIMALSKIFLYSITGTLVCSLFIILFLASEENKLTSSFVIFIFVLYLFTTAIFLSIFERGDKTYLYIRHESRGILYLHRRTLNDKLLLSTTRDIGSKTSQGSIFFENLDILDKYEIHFISKKYINFFWRGKVEFPIDDVDYTNQLLEQQDKVSGSKMTNDFT